MKNELNKIINKMKILEQKEKINIFIKNIFFNKKENTYMYNTGKQKEKKWK